eukprot:TRINITY_DN6236_c0_g1_i1.p2 TRINITY_DN6236_c0_g1~~TRINITY_DN6236_c0_g1_i1.p2  ORF type:complete len:420 (+),score=128.64 TRINITY_DN6236_c0_g1_i1:89-1348(+)
MSAGDDVGVRLCYVLLAGTTAFANVITIPVSVHLLILATSTIYIASHHALFAHEEDVEKMKKKDVYMFPIIASCSLFGLYLLFKFLPKEYINFVMKIYFSFIGAFVIGSTLAQAFKTFISKDSHAYWDVVLLEFDFPKINIPFLSGNKKEGAPAAEREDSTTKTTNAESTSASKETAATEKQTAAASATGKKSAKAPPKDVVIHRADLVGLPFGVLAVALYGLTNHWTLTNIMGISFSIQAIGLMNLGTFMNGLILLSGLFIYDIFWVFGTEVMVSVATKFDVPIKVLFPRGSDQSPAMLGLGDIVIPGIFIAMMLRVDLHLETASKHIDLKKASLEKYVPKSKVYFLTCLASYIVGMGVTLFVMFYFNHAQPALLYLVPANLLSVIVLGFFRGQFKTLLNYSEEADPNDDESAKVKPE